MMTKKKRRLLVISIIISIIVILLITFIILYLKTDMFKSNQTLFLKYLGKNADIINSLQTDTSSEKYDIYASQSEIKVNYSTNIGTTSESTDNSINQLKLKIDGQTDRQSKYDYKKIQLLKQDNPEMTVEYANNDNIYGIHFSDLFDQYITAENSNVKELAKKVGYPDEITANMPDSINFNLENLERIQLTNEEIELLKEKYVELISINTTKENFNKEKSSILKINNNNIVANVYSLNLTKEQLNSLYIKILENIKQDEIILNKINEIQNIYNEITLGNSKNINIKEQIEQKIDTKIRRISENNIGNEPTKIMVYESNGQTIRTTIQLPDSEITMDYLIGDEETYINISNNKKEEVITNITFEINQNSRKIIIEDNREGEPKMLTYQVIRESQENKITNKCAVMYQDKTQKAEVNIMKNIEQKQKIDNQVKLDNTNSINLTALDEEGIKQITNQVKSGVNEKVKQVKESIKFEDITTMLKNIGIIRDQEILNSNGITEVERIRFNSKFELLQGDNKKAEDVNNVINTIKDNIINAQIASNQELKVEISREKNNQEIVKILQDFFTKDRYAEYNIKVEYDENKLVKYLNVTIVERE